MRAISLALVLVGLAVECEALVDPPFIFGACAENDTFREARIAGIREEILVKLRLTEPPRDPTRPAKINKSTFSAYSAAVQATNNRAVERPPMCRRNTFFAKKIFLYFPTSFQSVIPPAEVFEWGPVNGVARRDVDASKLQDYVPPTSYRLIFEDLDIGHNTLLWSADLRLYKQKKEFVDLEIKQERSPQTTENIEIYYVSKDGDEKDSSNLILVSSKVVEAESEGYESFDITQAIRQWNTNNHKLLELEVVVKCPQSIVTGLAFLPTIEFSITSGKSNQSAQLVVATLKEKEVEAENEARLRRKRQSEIDSGFCLSHPEESNCCLRKLKINFRRDLGWRWVLAPRTFRPNFCEGLCPFFWPSASTSTTLLIRYSEMNPTAAVKPCCVPASMKPLTLLIIINGRIYLEELPDMIVESCICR